MRANIVVPNQVGSIDMTEMHFAFTTKRTRCHSRIFRFEAGYEADVLTSCQQSPSSSEWRYRRINQKPSVMVGKKTVAGRHGPDYTCSAAPMHIALDGAPVAAPTRIYTLVNIDAWRRLFATKEF